MRKEINVNTVYEFEGAPNNFMRLGVEMELDEKEPYAARIRVEDLEDLLRIASESGKIERLASVWDVKPNDDDEEFNRQMDAMEQKCRDLLA